MDKTSDDRRREAVADLVQFLCEGGATRAVLDGPSKDFSSSYFAGMAQPLEDAINGLRQNSLNRNDSHDFLSFWDGLVHENLAVQVIYSDPRTRRELEDALFSFDKDVFWGKSDLSNADISQTEISDLKETLSHIQKDLLVSLCIAQKMANAFSDTPLNRSAQNVFSGVMKLNEDGEMIERLLSELNDFPKSKNDNFRGSKKAHLDPLWVFTCKVAVIWHDKGLSLGNTKDHDPDFANFITYANRCVTGVDQVPSERQLLAAVRGAF